MNWTGPYFKGAMRLHRQLKRAEAERRNAATPAHRRRSARRAPGVAA
jgi:hypothetical protein